MDDLKERLDAQQYAVTQEGATDPAFSHPLYKEKRKGRYACVVCGAPLFASDQKFESGSGWPSFWAPSKEGEVATRADLGHGMVRVEAACGKCGAHLGHLFPDGPAPTGMRYCINGSALEFRAADPS